MSMVLYLEPRTRAELLALPDDGCRHELVDGQHLVTPAPTTPHQFAQGRLLEVLVPHVLTHSLGRLLPTPADLTLGEDEVLQPDLFLLPPIDHVPADWETTAVPLLVIEIVSPSSARVDREVKRRRYQRAGVPEYWIVDPMLRQVEVWRPNAPSGEVWQERFAWRVPADASLDIDVQHLFD